MSNNDILKKLRVALKLRDEDIIHILSLANFEVSKSELGALFRSEDHPNYKECGDQLLRNFLNGLIIHMRGPMEQGDKPVTEKAAMKKDKPKIVVKKAVKPQEKE